MRRHHISRGNGPSPLTGSANQSYERKPGGDTACYDTNNNYHDFALLSPANPQNRASPAVMCPGVPTVTATRTPSRTPTRTRTCTPTPTPTRTATPAPPAHLVISEFRTRGPNGDSDEFVELYNPTGAAVTISGWTIRKSSGCGTSISTLVYITYTPTTILQPGQHYLVAATGSSITGADQTFSPDTADDGGLGLVNPAGLTIDQVGMCAYTWYREGTPLTPLTGTTNQSYERKPGGSTSCYDTESNARDFALISPAKPQNMASPRVVCPGAVVPTGSSTPTSTLTRTFTPFPTAYPGNVAINEFLPHPRTDWNEDGTADTGDEYIEIINMGVSPINLGYWKLDDADGGSSPYTLPSITLAPHQIVHFFGSETGISLSDGGDTVRLLKPDGRTADIYTYPVVSAVDRTWCRLPDGNGVWGFVCRPTPGRPNTPLVSTTPGPGSEPTPGIVASCLLADTVPQPMRLAECEAFGSGIWNSLGEKQFWLQSRWKWDVFVE